LDVSLTFKIPYMFVSLSTCNEETTISASLSTKADMTSLTIVMFVPGIRWAVDMLVPVSVPVTTTFSAYILYY